MRGRYEQNTFRIVKPKKTGSIRGVRPHMLKIQENRTKNQNGLRVGKVKGPRAHSKPLTIHVFSCKGKSRCEIDALTGNDGNQYLSETEKLYTVAPRKQRPKGSATKVPRREEPKCGQPLHARRTRPSHPSHHGHDTLGTDALAPSGIRHRPTQTWPRLAARWRM